MSIVYARKDETIKEVVEQKENVEYMLEFSNIIVYI